jgi:hypothetical protein
MVALGALSLGLTAALLMDLARGGRAAAPGGRILPDWDPARVRAVRLEHRGRPAVVVARDGAGWRVTQPIAAPADPSAVADLLGTLEIMAARRRADGRVADPILSITVERSGQPAVTLDLAQDAGQTDRVWLSRRGEDRRSLIDGYQVRAFDLTADDLREQRPFRGRVTGATRIGIVTAAGKVELEGPPWRVGGVRADPDRVAALVAALERLRAGSFLPAPPSGAPALSIAVAGKAGLAEVTVRGDCPDGGAAALTPVGAACLPPAEVGALAAVAADPTALQDRRLLAAQPDEVKSAAISLGERSITVARADQPEVVRDWAARFSAAAAAGPPIAAADLPVTGRVEVDTDAGREEIAILRAPDGRPAARRASEPVAFPLVDSTVVDPDPRFFRSLDLLSADPTEVVSLRRGGEQIERGELLEEWRAVSPAGAEVDAEAAAALAEMVATLRAVRVAPVRSGRVHVAIEVELAPPPGESAPVRHRIELAEGPKGTCSARIDDDPVAFELAPESCTALRRPFIRRRP